MATEIVYDGPPSKPIRRTVWIFPDGSFWCIDLSDGPPFMGIREKKVMGTVKTIIETLENGEQIIEMDVTNEW